MHFFPSSTLAIYMAKMFLIRTFAVLALLVLVLQALDLLGQSGDILAYEGNGEAELWTYISLRAPQIIARFLPFSVLLGTLITLATLNQNSEVVSMKAGGLSAHQILAPLVLASMMVAVLSFTFNEMVVAPATDRLSKWERVDYGPVPKEDAFRNNVWVKDGEDLVNAAQTLGRGPQVTLQSVTVYRRLNGSLQTILRAPIGAYSDAGWVLTDVTRFEVRTGKKTTLDRMIVGPNLRPDQFTLSNVNAEGLSLTRLGNAIEDLRDAGRPTSSLEAEWWHKISGPLSAVLMPLLGAVAAFGLARSGRLFIRAVIGMALGFTYFVADNFALAMGNLGAYPPILAAWAPFILFLLIGETVLIRTEE